jgi:hypothetical protein
MGVVVMLCKTKQTNRSKKKEIEENSLILHEENSKAMNIFINICKSNKISANQPQIGYYNALIYYTKTSIALFALYIEVEILRFLRGYQF